MGRLFWHILRMIWIAKISSSAIKSNSYMVAQKKQMKTRGKFLSMKSSFWTLSPRREMQRIHHWRWRKMQSWRYSMRGFGEKSWSRMRCRVRERSCLFRNRLIRLEANGTATLHSTSCVWGIGLKQSTTRSNRSLMIAWQMPEAKLNTRETRISIKRLVDLCEW